MERRNVLRPGIDVETLVQQGVSTLDQVLTFATLWMPSRRDIREKREVIELRIFAGLTIEEIAAVEGLAPATVKRAIKAAKTFLKAHFGDA